MTDLAVVPPPPKSPAGKDMVWVPGGAFLMGSEDFYPEERPVHRVSVDGFWMDEHPVTVAEFRRFVEATGYVTVAERPPDPADYPDADPELLVPGLARLPQDRAGRSTSTTSATGGRTCPGATGSGPRARAARSTAATATRSSTSPTRTPRPTPPGRARSCRPRPSGSARRAAASRARPSPGATSTAPGGRPMANTWQGGFPWQNLRARRLRGHVAGRQLPAERLRPLRHGRQRVGVDVRLLHAARTRTRSQQRVLRAAQPAGRRADELRDRRRRATRSRAG